MSNHLTPLQEVGELLRIERLRARLSQGELGGRVGIDKAVVCRIEQGKRPLLPVVTLMRLSEELGISPTEITAPFFTDCKPHRLERAS